jgi:hypothetical protein
MEKLTGHRKFMILKKSLLVACASLLGSVACAGGDDEPPLLRFSLATKINKIVIHEMAIKAEIAKDLPEDCSAFKMSTADVRAYFRSTNTITAQHFNHTISWSPCYIRGSLTLKDGRVGEWSIQQYRGGRLSVGKSEFYLYCPTRCKAKALI